MDEKTVTEREARLREREAFKDGAIYALQRNGVDRSSFSEAERRYPITKKAHRKIAFARGELWVTDGGFLIWQAVGGAHGSCLPVSDFTDLLENPYEEISE